MPLRLTPVTSTDRVIDMARQLLASNHHRRRLRINLIPAPDILPPLRGIKRENRVNTVKDLILGSAHSTESPIRLSVGTNQTTIGIESDGDSVLIHH
jgi:hypothetical protein